MHYGIVYCTWFATGDTDEPLGPSTGGIATRCLLRIFSRHVILLYISKVLTFRSHCWARHVPHWFALLGMMRVPHRQQGIWTAVFGWPAIVSICEKTNYFIMKQRYKKEEIVRQCVSCVRKQTDVRANLRTCAKFNESVTFFKLGMLLNITWCLW